MHGVRHARGGPLSLPLTNRPRRLLVGLERYQAIGSIDYGFFDPKTAHTTVKIEDEDERNSWLASISQTGAKLSMSRKACCYDDDTGRALWRMGQPLCG